MSHRPTSLSLIEETRRHLPNLSRQLLNGTQQALTQHAHNLRLQDGWGRFKARFAPALEAELGRLLELCAQGVDPLVHTQPAALEELTLADNRQSLRSAAMSHGVSTIEAHCKLELHQLNNFFAALRGTARARKTDNPIRPALFVEAFYEAMAQSALNDEDIYAIVKAGTPTLANALQMLYALLCAQLKAAELTQLVASHGASTHYSDPLRRSIAEQAQSEQSTLDGLAKRFDEVVSRPGAHSTLQGLAPGDMLAGLYDRIVSDPRLPLPIKDLLEQLRPLVARLAQSDSSMLLHQDHPAWRLINRIASHGAGYSRHDDPRLQAFIAFMSPAIAQLKAMNAPDVQSMQALQQQMDAFLTRLAQQQYASEAGGLMQQERREQRQEWQALLREQLRAQMADMGMSQSLRRFLLGPWIEVIVHAMLQHGRESSEAQRYIDWVDHLHISLQPVRSESSIPRLRALQQRVLDTLTEGMHSVSRPQSEIQEAHSEIRSLYERVRLGQALPVPPAEPTPISPQDMSPEALLQRLLQERDAPAQAHWAHSDIDRGELPTVPVQLYAEPESDSGKDAFERWMSALQIGNWYHMSVKEQWITAQVAWISESRQFFLFVCKESDERHSLTRNALEQMLSKGLITALEERSIVQRAVDTLLQDLGP